MSRRALNDAFAVVASMDMGNAAKLVLFALANRHHQETGRCDPSVERLCADMRLSERGVRKALRQLENLDVISTRHRKQRHTGAHRNLTNSYVLRGLDGARSAGRVGHSVPPKREEIRAREASVPWDLAMLLDGEDE